MVDGYGWMASWFVFAVFASFCIVFAGSLQIFIYLLLLLLFFFPLFAGDQS